MHPFTKRVLELVQQIPHGKVTTYGGIAELAGSPKGARQVVRVLYSCTEKYQLPWHRVVKKNGKIGLARGKGFEEQKLLLENEGIAVGHDGKVDLEKHLWRLMIQE